MLCMGWQHAACKLILAPRAIGSVLESWGQCVVVEWVGGMDLPALGWGPLVALALVQVARDCAYAVGGEK